MSVSYSLDWLRWSVPLDVPTDSALPAMECFAPDDDLELKPLPYYTSVEARKCARIDWNVARPEQKRLVTMDGQALRRFRAAGGDEMNLLAFVLSLKDVTISRLDFAIDLRDEVPPGAILDLLTAWTRGELVTHAQTVNRVDGYVRGGRQHGLTLYIGSRSSPTFLRVYDKAAQLESRTGGDWIRIELECKKPIAAQVAKAMTMQDIASAGCAAIRRYVRTPVVWFEKCTEIGAYAIVPPAGRYEGDFERWIWETVIPALDKALKTPVDGLDKALLILVENARRSGLHG